jgi:hypothetical protein
MTAFTIHVDTSSAKKESSRKPKPSERDCRTLKSIVSKNHRPTAANVTAELIFNLKTLFHKTVRLYLHKSNFHGRAVIAKHLVTENRAQRRKGWCDGHKIRTSDDWKYIIGSYVALHVIPNIRPVYIWRTPKEIFNPECLIPTVKHWGGTVIILAAISFYSAGPIITLHGRITASDYVDISRYHLHPKIQIFSLTLMQFFKMTIRQYTLPEVYSLSLKSMTIHFYNFPGQHIRQAYISSTHCGQFQIIRWEEDFLLLHLSRSWKMFLTKSGTIMH